jgi:hypothetical protein
MMTQNLLLIIIKYNNYKVYKLNSIKLLIYNESDKKKLELLNIIELHEKLYNDISNLII